jgi:hypothetical protein
MKDTKAPVLLALIAIAAIWTGTARAQAVPAGTQKLQLSAFAGATGTFTDFNGGKNLGITAGADLTFLTFRLFRPSVEARGTYPVDSGQLSGQKNFLIGPKVEVPFGRLHPYADFLVGRGQSDYVNGGFIYGNLLYILTNTIVYSPGVGLDYDLGHNLAVKADAQFQIWHAPPTPSGTIYPTALTLGVTYTFDFNPHHHPQR